MSTAFAATTAIALVGEGAEAELFRFRNRTHGDIT